MCDLSVALGMTLDDVRHRMGQDEFQTWAAYVEKNGPLNPMLRFEAMLARVASPFLRNTSARDLMVWPRVPEADATPETMLLMLKNLASASKRKH